VLLHSFDSAKGSCDRRVGLSVPPLKKYFMCVVYAFPAVLSTGNAPVVRSLINKRQ
jgi:hypothetical protein